MHYWFALNPSSPTIIEVKGIHQFDWLTRDNVPILEAVESHFGVQNYYHGNHLEGANLSDTTPRSFASKLLVPSCCVIFDLEPFLFDFDFNFEIFKSLSFSLDRLCHLAILCLDQHDHTLHHLESLLIISPEA
ncbi:probable galacturonosyltransferase 14 isoform X2 [Tanacetum coccineum]